MSDLVTFLRARLDEDEAVLRACAGGVPQWRPEDIAIFGPDLSPEVRTHIARHDPARVLKEIEAKRRVVELHRPVQKRSTGSGGGVIEDCQVCDHFPARYPCTTLRLLALPYADHPDYQEQWRP